MTTKYDQIESPRIPSSILNLSGEGISVIDLNNDGIKDIVITNNGLPWLPIQPDDPPITILMGHKDFTFTLADTSNLPPTGWVNDYVFMDSNGNGLLEIIAIDHGREIAHEPKYWSKLHVYEFEPNSQKFVDISSLTMGNEIGFYHHSANTSDINQDGFSDFITAMMGPGNFKIFLGNNVSIFNEATEQVLGTRFHDVTEWNSNSYIGAGAAGSLDISGDGDYDLILLPYTDSWTQKQSYAQVFEFEEGSFQSDRLFNVRVVNDLVLPAGWGYSFFKVEDINNDGLHDVVALAELPGADSEGAAIFVSMIQNHDGSFNVTRAFPNEPLQTNRRGEPFVGHIWQESKFTLEDLDSDGDLDLYWGHWFGGGQVYFKDGIFINDGSGHFFRDLPVTTQIANQVIWSGNGGARSYMSDINNDGIGDFLIFDSNFEDGNSWTTTFAYVSNVDGFQYGRDIRIGALSSDFEFRLDSETPLLIDKLMTDGFIPIGSASRISFQDLNIALDVDKWENAGSAYRLYKAAFDRAPDESGLGYWIDVLDDGGSLQLAASGFINSAEFQSLYGANPSDTLFLTKLYNNVLDRDPDQGGLNYWIGQLNGGMSRESALINFSESNENVSNVAALIDNGIQYQPWIG